TFLKSPIAARMAASPLLLREFPFAIERPVTDFASADTLPPDARTETVLVQGIVDAVFEENGELVIVDYKTDRVKTADELVLRYRPQLEVYKAALSRALQRPVARSVIYSFHLGVSIDL
ncbi:MAG: PD-(D/E)XK nuclease family protein, partial [Clostridia bacterium]|nr:PD-(D/E)XK nuclease family protein [Clostridia bacterium]